MLFTLSSGAMSVFPAITATTAPAMLTPKEVVSADYGPITDSKNVEKFLKDYFSDIPLLAKVGACESRNRQYDASGQVLRGKENSYDRGVMQINILYHQETAEKMGLDLNKIDDNVAYARYLYEKFGAKPWMSSSPCWSKSLTSEVAKK